MCDTSGHVRVCLVADMCECVLLADIVCVMLPMDTSERFKTMVISCYSCLIHQK